MLKMIKERSVFRPKEEIVSTINVIRDKLTDSLKKATQAVNREWSTITMIQTSSKVETEKIH
ncbi:MAG: hypothetical protein IPQ25_10420 [Chitinophagaceae bacterium]|nr:hypothetical protein [Chitinophagaceae bacterium]